MKNNFFDNIDVPKDIDSSIKSGINRAVIEKRKKRNKIAIATFSLCLIIVCSSVILNDKASANVKNVFWNIASYLGLNWDVDEYKTMINKPVSNNGYAITIDEAILDKNELVISSTIRSDECEFNGSLVTSSAIYINGKLLQANSNSIEEYVDNSTINRVDSYQLSDELNGDINIKINYSNISIMGDYDTESISGEWNFEFNTNADILENDTIEIDLDEKTKLNDDEDITLKKYSSNSLGTSIEYERSSYNSEYSIKLIGKDNLGNDIEFYPSIGEGGGCIFKLDNSIGEISKDATELKMFAYISKTLADDSWEKAGNEILINIK